jgi:cytoskeleton protein RodZ
MTELDKPETAGPGARLADARKKGRMSVDEIARQLKLPRTTIENIEAGRFDRIAVIYRRGYIANYARRVGLDPQPLLDSMGDPEPEPLRRVLPVRAGGRGFERFVKFATYALVTTVIVPPLVYFFVQGGARLFEPERTDESAVVQQSPDAAGPAYGYRQRMADALAVQPGGEDRSQGALSASALPVTLRPQATSGAAASPAPDEPPALDEPVDRSARLTLTLDEDSWVEIEDAAGERLEFDLLRAGQSRDYGGVPPFRLLLGRGSAVGVLLNGEPVAFEGHGRAGVAEFEVGEAPTANDSSVAPGRN